MRKTGASSGKVDSLEALIRQATSQLQALQCELTDTRLTRLTPKERIHTTGRLRDGEAAIMNRILECIDRCPGWFLSLAARDHGEDPQRIETDPARDALRRREALLPLVDTLEHLLSHVKDELLACGQFAKDVTVPAYAILKANAAVDPEIRQQAADVLGFYANLSRRRTAPVPSDKP